MDKIHPIVIKSICINKKKYNSVYMYYWWIGKYFNSTQMLHICIRGLCYFTFFFYSCFFFLFYSMCERVCMCIFVDKMIKKRKILQAKKIKSDFQIFVKKRRKIKIINQKRKDANACMYIRVRTYIVCVFLCKNILLLKTLFFRKILKSFSVWEFILKWVA